MTPQRERWKQFLAGIILLLSLILPAQAALAFLAQGCWAVFGGQLLGFPVMGIEPSTGASGTRTGVLLILLGLICALVAFVGIRYSLREIRNMGPGR